MTMQEYRNYIIILSLFLLFIVGSGTFCILFQSCGLDNKGRASESGTVAPVTQNTATSTQLIPSRPEAVTLIPGGPGPLLSAGTGTTTLRAQTPFNDILIAETGSEYATLRNARYSMWPYPGEIRFKEIYIVLPEVYEPVFPGYSNDQFTVTSDGQKQVVLYLRHQKSVSVGADTEVFIQAPIQTDEAEHPMTLLESSDAGAVYSLITKGEEVLVEVTYKRTAGLSVGEASSARTELLRAIERMEVVW